MTITTTANKTVVTCNGVQTVFAYAFEIPTGSGFQLTQTTTLTGVQSVISTSNYSVSGIGQAGGGTFTYSPGGGAVAAGNTLTFLRQVPEEQLTSLINQGGYYPAAVEQGLDWIVMMIQDLNEQMGRCIKTNKVDGSAPADLVPAAQRANLALKFDGSGNPYAG